MRWFRLWSTRFLARWMAASKTRGVVRRRLNCEYLEDRSVPSIAAPDYVLTHFSTAAAAAGTSAAAPYTPAQISGAYGVNGIQFTGGVSGNGAGQTIAIVDAYNDPNALADLQTFDAKYGLANPPSFAQLNQNGQAAALPGTDPTGGWEVEESLDIEWAHAIAPAAKIVLVEANSANTNDLFAAAQTAAKLASVVSMSWGMQGGFAGETAFDGQFNVAGVTFLASTGDNGYPGSYPAESPNIVAVGGTSLTINGSSSYGGETAWSDSGGGISPYEARPAYQNSVSSVVGSGRGTPDVSFDANPNTGVWVYDSYDTAATGGPWIGVGGTSLSAPAWAGLIAIADQGRTAAGLSDLSSAQTLSALYSLPSSDFHDITSGNNGGYSAKAGYDLVSGLGTPIANLLVPALAGETSAGGGTTGSGTGSGTGTTGGGTSGGTGSTGGGGPNGGAGTPSGSDYSVAEFPGAGIYRFSDATGAWTKLSSATNATSLAVDASGNVVAELPGTGVWLYQSASSSWTQLTQVDAIQVSIAGNQEVVGSFGSGVFRWQPSTGWVQLTSSVTSSVAIDGNGDVAGQFQGLGVWRFENSTGWEWLTSGQAAEVAIAGNGVVAASFASGVWRYQDTTGWAQLTSSVANSIAVDANGDVIGAFGSLGVWSYTNSGGWTQISAAAAYQVSIAADGEVLASFANGVFRHQNGKGWTALSGSEPTLIALGE